MIRTVIFDLDGTLVHSAPDLQTAANRMLADLRHPPLDIATVITFIGNGVEMLVRRCLSHVGHDAQDLPRALALFHTHYARDLTTLTVAYPGVVTLLETLQNAGVAMGLCTNKPEGPARQLCEDLDLARFFPVILGGDTLDVRKPDPKTLRHVITALDTNGAETLYVGDSETDYLTARRAGIRFAFFDGGYQTGEIAGFKPDIVVSNLFELAPHILGDAR